MQSFSSLILERGVASLPEVEASIANQTLFGGDLGTNLVEVGAIKENALQRLLSEYYELPIGPQGRLPDPDEEIASVFPAEMIRRFGVYPVKKTRRTLHVATSRPLDPDSEGKLKSALGMQLKAVIVTPLRLAEALSRVGVTMKERERRLIDLLDAGIKPSRKPNPGRRPPETMMFPEAPPYRRMSEHPRGIVPSTRQPKPRPRRAPLLRETVPPRDSVPAGDTKPPPVSQLNKPTTETTPPDTLDGVGPPESDSPVSARPRTKSARPVTISSLPPDDEPKRDTHPYEDPSEAQEEEEAEDKRDTHPWRDDGDEEDDGALSVRGEFTASLSEAPPSDEAKVNEDRRHFRHRGPFTRAQAELAVSQAPSVQTVLEILARYARQFFERCLLLAVQGNRASLRLSHGLGIEWARFEVSLAEPGIFHDTYESADPIMRALDGEGSDAAFKSQLGVGDGRVCVVPLVIRERVVAMFYGDDRRDDVDKDAVADVTDFAEICAAEIMRIMLQRKRAGL